MSPRVANEMELLANGSRKLQLAAEAENRRLTEGLLEAERIDRSHGFTLPGDSALYIFLWGIEQRVPAGEPDGGGAK